MEERAEGKWQPTRFERWHDCDEKSSTGVAHILTDVGPAVLKALGNKEGPHALVREFIGTSLARWFGPATFDFALIHIESWQEIKLGGGKRALPGAAFVTRVVSGGSWSSKEKDLKQVVNPDDITRLVMVDTWLLNADRCPPKGSARHPNHDNVFLSLEGMRGKDCRLIAMDFSDCLKVEQELTSRIAQLRHIRDERLYGLFPAFERYVTRAAYEAGLARLAQVTEPDMANIVNHVPRDWQMPASVRRATTDFLVQRARFLLEHLPTILGLYAQEQEKLPGTE